MLKHDIERVHVIIASINIQHMASWENNRGGFWPTWQENKLFTVLFALLMIALIFLAGTSAKKALREMMHVGYSDQAASTIVVSATGSADVTPDIATTEVTVTKQGATAAEAQNSASDAMNTVIVDIKLLNISEEDLRTSSFSTTEVYDYDVSPARLAGYQSTQTLTVKIRDTDLTASVLDTATKSGATSVSGIHYEVDDETSTIAKARNEAIADAKAQASAIAKSVGARLGRVVSYSENRNGGGYPMYYGMAESVKAMDSVISNVEVGQNTIEMTVYLTYSLY